MNINRFYREIGEWCAENGLQGVENGEFDEQVLQMLDDALQPLKTPK